MRGILESVKYHVCSHINSHSYLGLIDRDKLLRLCWMVTVKKEVVIWDFPLSEWHCQDGLLGVGIMGEGWRNIYSAPFPIGYDWSLGT